MDLLRTLSANVQRAVKGRARVVVVGAGMSGLCMAKKLRDAGVEDVVILEKSDRLGGTWAENVYPGVACDVPSHLYSFSFFLDSRCYCTFNFGGFLDFFCQMCHFFLLISRSFSFTRAFSPGSEIWDYLDKLATHFDLHKLIK